MFSFFISHSVAEDLKPLILIPGLYGSPLFGQADKTYKKSWYCPKYLKRHRYWVNLKLVPPPFTNCIFSMMTIQYDEATDTFKDQPGFNTSIEDFGGSAGIEYVDSSFFDWHFIESFHSFANYLRGKGYEFKKNLFGAPYDWRLGMAGLTPLYAKIKALVEQAYEQNNHQKVTILGYSLGGYVSQHLLSNITTKEWKDKYIRRVIFLAPAFGGSGDSLVPSYTLRFPLLKFLNTKPIRTALSTTPVLHVLFPNHVVFGDTPLAIDENGQVVATAATWGDFLIEHGKLTNENNGIKIFQKNLWFNHHRLEDPGVDTTFLFNSGISTDLTLRFKKGFKKSPSVDTVAGDGTVPALGILWAMENWDSKNHAIHVTDFAQSGKGWDHGGLGSNNAVVELIYQAAMEDLPQSGLTMTTLPPYEKKQGKWVPKENANSLDSGVIPSSKVSNFVSQLREKYSLQNGSRELSSEEAGDLQY